MIFIVIFLFYDKVYFMYPIILTQNVKFGQKIVRIVQNKLLPQVPALRFAAVHIGEGLFLPYCNYVIYDASKQKPLYLCVNAQNLPNKLSEIQKWRELLIQDNYTSHIKYVIYDNKSFIVM